MLEKIKVQRMAAARNIKVITKVRFPFCWPEVVRRTIEVMAPESNTAPMMVSITFVLM